MTRPLEPDDLYAIALADDPQITPDGDRIVYIVTGIDRASYEYRRHLWIVPTDGGDPRQFTAGPNDTAPRWSLDGRWLAFVRAPAGERKPKNEEERDRGVGKPQLWIMPADGGEARQLTYAQHGAGDPVWSTDGRSLILTAEVGDADDGEAEDGPLKEKQIPAAFSTMHVSSARTCPRPGDGAPRSSGPRQDREHRRARSCVIVATKQGGIGRCPGRRN